MPEGLLAPLLVVALVAVLAIVMPRLGSRPAPPKGRRRRH
jgi:hypothetical protein